MAIPGVPKGLSAKGKAIWRSLTDKLFAAGLVADADELTLKLLVDSLLLYDEASRGIKGRLTVTTAKGNEIQNPLLGVRNRAWA
ncbi:MAG TPA: P27 family phage terminase small subunit [Pirellulales bacterium]|nr:P27 family phage terminase small subunit [Pirellulales bacterium]